MSYPIFEIGLSPEPDDFDMDGLPINEEACFINPNCSEWHGNAETDLPMREVLTEFFESFPFWDESILAHVDEAGHAALYKHEMLAALIPLINNSARKVMRSVKGISDKYILAAESEAPVSVGLITDAIKDSAYKQYPVQPGIYEPQSGSNAGFSLVEIFNLLEKAPEDILYLSNTIIRIK